MRVQNEGERKVKEQHTSGRRRQELLKVPPHDVNKLIHEWNKAQEANAKFSHHMKMCVCVYLRSEYGARETREHRLWLFFIKLGSIVCFYDQNCPFEVNLLALNFLNSFFNFKFKASEVFYKLEAIFNNFLLPSRKCKVKVWRKE